MPEKNNTVKTIHFFTKGDANTASSRQRAYNIAERLTQYGFHCIVHEPFVNKLNKAKWPKKAKVIYDFYECLLQVKHNDVVYLQRAVYSNFFLKENGCLILMTLFSYICRSK